MISKKVVFVLGAGASVPYNYPDGWGLVRRMHGLSGEVRPVVDLCGYRRKEWECFQEALKGSRHSSIDAFLESRKRNPRERELGKLLIAAYLMGYENKQQLTTAAEDDWYTLLLNKLDGSFDQIAHHCFCRTSPSVASGASLRGGKWSW